jgi:hypothetical protein
MGAAPAVKRGPGSKKKAVAASGRKKAAAKKSPAKRRGRPRKTAAKAKA